MSTAERMDRRMTPAEYAVWEREQVERHEYYAGEVFSQAGGTRRHSLIGSNAVRAIGNLLIGHACQAHGSDMRVRIEATGYEAYPDVSVVCPPFASDTEDVITDPILLVEVLSPSTSDFDRGGKFGHYRQIPSLIEYLVFWQDEARVEQHTRTNEGLWLLRELVGIDQTLQLQSIQHPLQLSQVYDKVVFADP